MSSTRRGRRSATTMIWPGTWSMLAEGQLSVVLTPRLMQLRRLVIGEVSRFPELAAALYEGGPGRAIASLTTLFEDLAARGLLTIDDPEVAAVPVQLAGDGRAAQPGHAAGRCRDPRTGGVAPVGRAGCSRVPRGVQAHP